MNTAGRKVTLPKPLPRVTPLHLQIMLAANLEELQPQRWASAPVQEFAQELVEAKLIEVINRDPDTSIPMGWITTDRGSAWLKMLLATPLPVSAFMDPRNGEVIA